MLTDELSNKAAVVINSNERVSKSIIELLTCSNWQVKRATTIPQALELLHKTKWQLIFFSRTLQGVACLPVERQLEQLQPDAHLFLVTDGRSSRCDRTESPVRDIFCEIDLSIDNEQAGINALRMWLPLVEERIVELKDAVILPIDKYAKSPIIGECQAIQKVRQQIEVLAHTAEPCLITGEDGTGKLLVARTIHEMRCGNDAPPMVLIMCEEENENFGTLRRRSRLSEVLTTKKCGAVLINQLDAASDMVQNALLNLDYEASASMNIIASSCRNLPEMVAHNRFSSELYTRLKNYIYLPPLRERRQDIGLLLAHFAQQFVDKSFVRVSQQAWNILQNYDWQYNLPELHNVALSAVASGAGAICVMDIPSLTRAS